MQNTNTAKLNNLSLETEGMIKATSKAFGFIEMADGQSSFVPPAEMKKVMHGDIVVAKITTMPDGRTSAELKSLVTPALTDFVGRIRRTERGIFVEPDHPLMNNFIFIPPAYRKGLNDGDWVRARLSKHPFSTGLSAVEILHKIAVATDARAPWLVTLDQFQLQHNDIDSLLDNELLEKMQQQTSAAFSNRVDLTALPFVTIDSEATKDMDDALHIESLSDGGWSLTVAIADPTFFIKQEDTINTIAKERAFTTYLPGQVVPMLPRQLSEDLCSLKENEIRPALCCKMHIDVTGEVLKYEFFDALIKSSGKLVYDFVSDFTEFNKTEKWEPTSSQSNQVDLLNQMRNARYEWRDKNHLVFKSEKPDFGFVLNGNNVLGVERFERRTANKIVEEAMIAANICCADFLSKNGEVGIFSTHKGFDEERIEEASLIANNFSESHSADTISKLDGYCQLRRSLNDSDDDYTDIRLIQCHANSELSLSPDPHFGLGLEQYATFTSPIRKYGDMLNHRRIKSILAGKLSDNIPTEDDLLSLQEGSEKSRRSERALSDWLYARLLKKSLGDKFLARIFRVTKGGCQVTIEENGARTFIPTNMICKDKDRVAYDVDAGRVFIDNTQVCQINDLVNVMIFEVVEDKRNITSALIL
jgi:exoribonuclease II